MPSRVNCFRLLIDNGTHIKVGHSLSRFVTRRILIYERPVGRDRHLNIDQFRIANYPLLGAFSARLGARGQQGEPLLSANYMRSHPSSTRYMSDNECPNRKKSSKPPSRQLAVESTPVYIVSPHP